MSVLGNKGLAELPFPNYEYITTTERALEVLPEIERYEVIEVDTETTGLDVFVARVVLLQIGVVGKAYVFDVRDGRVDAQIFRNILEGDKHLKLLQNAAYDYEVMKVNFNIRFNRVYDTMLAEQLLCLGLYHKYSLDSLVAKYLHMNMTKDIATSFQDYTQEYQEYQLRYAANDVSVLRDIYNSQLAKLRQDGLMRAAKLEFDFIEPMCEMELNGMLLDVGKWREIIGAQIIERDRLRIQLSSQFDRAVDQQTLFGVSLLNLDSPQQVVEGLNILGIPVKSSDVKELSRYQKHPVVKTLLEYREYEKFITTYGEPVIERIHPVTGRLHTRFRQMVSTGRLSSSNPNLQNIPKLQKYRSCFIARPGHKLITSDLSQCELGILASYSQDPVFLEAFAHDFDLHTKTAADLFGISYDEVIADNKLSDNDSNKKNYRGSVKSLNFGLCITGDSELITDKGIRTIEDVDVDDVVAHDVGDNIVIDKMFKGEKEVFEIVSKFGYSLEGTEDHKIKIIDINGNYIDKKIGDLDIKNDYVCIKIGSNLFPDTYFSLSEKLDERWASFLGLFVVRGSLQKARLNDGFSIFQFVFSEEERGFINGVRMLFSDLFEDVYTECVLEDTGMIQFSVGSVFLDELIKNAFNGSILEDNQQFVMYVPQCIKNSPADVQISFLRWFFWSGGAIKNDGNDFKVIYVSESNRLVKDIQLMMLNFGIVSSIIKEQAEDGLDVYYNLYIIGNSSVFKKGVDGIILNRLNKLNSLFEFLNKNKIIPLPIESIQNVGIKKVYDISVDNHEYFLANGFVVHNCYGLTKVGLAIRMGVSEAKAQKLIDAYFNKYINVKRWLDDSARQAVSKGYTISKSGRRRYYAVPSPSDPAFKQLRGRIERQGMNAPIQGSNADVVKKAMVYIVDRIKPYSAQLLSTVHDEVIVESPEECANEVAAVVSKAMIDGFNHFMPEVKMKAGADVADFWVKG